MSQWGNDSQTNPAGQVPFYDPTKFQKNAAAEFNAKTNSQDGAATTQNTVDLQQGDPQQHQNAWNSWGGWDKSQYGHVAMNPDGSQESGLVSDQQPYGGQSDHWGQQYQGHWDPANGQQWGQASYDQAGTRAGQYEGYGANQYWADHVPTSFAGVDVNGHAADSSGYFYNQEGQYSQVPTSEDYGFHINHHSPHQQQQQPGDETSHIHENGSYSNFVEEPISDNIVDSHSEHEISGLDYQENIEGYKSGDNALNSEHSVPNANNDNEGTSVDGAIGQSKDVQEISKQLRDVSLGQNDETEENDLHDPQTKQRESLDIHEQETVPSVRVLSEQVEEPKADDAHLKEMDETTEVKREMVDENPAFSDWEMVGTEPTGSHSRNASLDNNVQFFISSNNSSARVSPAGSGKHEAHESGPLPVSKLTNPGPPLLQMSDRGAVLTQPSENPKGPLPPESFAITHSALDPSRSVNPYRNSPNTLTHSSSNNEVYLLSSTQLDVTKPNYENSPVVLNQSISPIPNTVDSRIPHSREHRENISPEIETAAGNSTSSTITDTPLTGSSRRTVAPSPITARKDSAFQPPKPKERGKPLRASHDIPGINIQSSKQSEVRGGDIQRPVDRDGQRTPDREAVHRQGGRRTPDMNSKQKPGGGRKTPDWDSERRPVGRKTPDWDSERRHRRSPDREGENRKAGRRTPDWDSNKRNDRDHDRYGRDRESDRLSSRPPAGNISKGPRARQSAFHSTQVSRARHNESPATTLWDEPDNLSEVSNILLMAASGTGDSTGLLDTNTSNAPPVLTPVASLITSMSEHIKGEGKDSKAKGRSDAKNRNNDAEPVDARDIYTKRDSKYGKVKDRDTREDMRRNRSSDNLGDGRGNKDSRNNSRERGSMYGSRSSLDLDDSRDRGRRGDSRDRSYRDRDDYYDRDRDRDRPTSRAGSTIDGGYRRDYRDRDRGDYRDREKDYRDRERDYRRTDKNDRDRDRPRSRYGDRPSSRHGDHDRSRADYDRESYYRDRHGGRGYDYEDYYRRGGAPSHYGSIYDRHYQDYYYSNYSQAGYYDEQGYYHQPDTTPRYPYDSQRRRSRAGTPGSLSDGGEEIFEYPPDLHDYSRGQGYDDYYGYYSQDQTYNGYRWDPHVSEWVLATPEVVPQRSTPEKFMIAHTRACFGPNGQLIQVLPNRPLDGQTATVEIHSVQTLLEESEESEELSAFPGPLVKGDTHKNDVLVFCQKKARACTENMELNDRDSAELIWKFLELLIKQNGTVVGTDIAHLILEGHEPTTLDYYKSGVRIRSQSVDNLDAEDDVSSDGQRMSNRTTPIDKSIINRSNKPVEEVTDRFRHLLMYGMKKDALDWAMKNNLWGHALFLASKMDTKAHATVMTRFANIAMRMNDPLQTLYQLMSGRQPAAVTSVAEERWGDWRPHLAMILSNHTQRPELDRKAITTLGDTLASRGFLHASHFCYLMSQTGFGSYNRKASKMVLIGSSHGLPLLEFANCEALQCTEIYEYALALGNMHMNMANFQYFKFLYATRLSDCGFAQEALHYCEVISKNINMYPSLYTVTLVKLVYELSSQLKYADPRQQDEADDEVRDPDWLRELHTTLVQFEEGAIQPVSGAVTPAFLPGTSASSESGEVGMYLQGTDHNGAGLQYNQDGSFMPHSSTMYPTMDQTGYQAQDVTDGSQYHYQHQDHLQVPTGTHHAQGSESGHMTSDAGHQYQQMGDNSNNTMEYQQTEGQQYGQLHWPNQQQPEQSANQMAGQESTNHMTGNESSNQHGHDPANHIAGHNTVNHYQTDSANHNHQTYYQQYGTNHNAGQWSHDQHHSQTSQHAGGFPPDVNLSESQTSTRTRDTAKRSSLASTTSVSQDGEDAEEEEEEQNGSYPPQPSIFDIQAPQQKIIPPRLRKRTTSECSAEGVSTQDKSKNQSQLQKQSLSEEKNIGADKSKSSGGIWNKLGGLFGGGAKKNEIKLPDDKEPSIVWDEAKKRWVDKDAGDQAETVAQPPPKDADISGLGSGPSPSGPPGVADTLPPGGNKFSRRKTLGARGQYVDVMNPKPAGGASVPSSLFHTLPNSHSAPAIFNPGGFPDTSSSDQRQDPIPEEKQQPSSNNSESTATPSVQQQLSDMDNATLPPQPTSVPSMPAMFNPSQFQGAQTYKQPVPTPGHRLSSRRVYPK